MSITRLSRISLILLALVPFACRFEDEVPLAYSTVSTCLRVPTNTEEVFRDEASWLDFHARHGSGKAPSIDFAQRIVVARFEGEGSPCTSFRVRNALVRRGRIVIEATRHVSTEPCIAVLAYPQFVLSVDRRDLPVFIRIAELHGPTAGNIPACNPEVTRTALPVP